jgi:hypothetical protein
MKTYYYTLVYLDGSWPSAGGLLLISLAKKNGPFKVLACGKHDNSRALCK